jgi:hypothetical protein
VGTKIEMIFRNAKKTPLTPPEAFGMHEKLDKKSFPSF